MTVLTRQRSSRRILLRGGLGVTGLLVAGGPLLAACGDDQPADAATGDAGGTLRYGGIGSAAAVTADPHGMVPSESDWARLSAIYDVLGIGTAHGGVEHRLAVDWRTDADATEHHVTLRDDAVFSDGTPVRATDVLYSLRRIAEKAAENGGRIGTVDVDSCRVESDHELVLVTSAPEADLFRALAGQCFIVPEGTEAFDEPVGSGPFMLSSLEGTTAVLVPNQHWYGEGPRVRRLEIRAFADPQALAAAVTSGEIDLAGNVAYPAAAAAEAQPELTVLRRPGAVSYPLVMNLDHAPFDQPQVRRAVKLAVDRAALVESVLLGYGEPGNDAPFFADPSYPDRLPAPERDLAAARDLLADAGYPDGFEAVIHATTAYPAMVSAATLLAGQLAEVGIEARVEEHPPETYWSEVYTQVPLFMGYTTDALPIGHWARATTLSTAPFNETGWRDEEFDAAFAAAVATVDDDERQARLRALQEQLAAEGGWVMWGIGDGVDLVAEAVQDPPTGSGFARYALAEVGMAD